MYNDGVSTVDIMWRKIRDMGRQRLVNLKEWVWNR